MTDNRTTELLPCPFCGGEARPVKQIEGRYAIARYSVSCNGCGLVAFYEATEAEAIAAWNTRAELKARISELEKQWDTRDSDCIALEAKVNRLEDEIADWSELHAQVLSERNHVIAERDEWKTKCETREFAYKQADAERKRYSEQIDELRAERDEWKAKLADMNAERHVETCEMEYQTDGMMSGWWKCSVCGEAMDTIKACAGREKPKYCGNCGRLVVA